jgi:hypothetical protein
VDEIFPDDTQVAFQLLLRQFPCDVPGMLSSRVVLMSQLYSLLADRTAADRWTENERRLGRLRVVKLPIGLDDFGLVSTDDYKASLQTAGETYDALSAESPSICPRHLRSQLDGEPAHAVVASAHQISLNREQISKLMSVWATSCATRFTELYIARDELLRFLAEETVPVLHTDAECEVVHPRCQALQPAAADAKSKRCDRTDERVLMHAEVHLSILVQPPDSRLCQRASPRCSLCAARKRNMQHRTRDATCAIASANGGRVVYRRSREAP